MTFAAFFTAVLALLLTPGPTNTLMAVAGAQGGLGRVGRLIPAELLGYLAVILPLATLGAQVLSHLPALALGVKLAAAVWVMVLAVRLWGSQRREAGVRDITARHVVITTVLNPKALIFGLILLPGSGDPAFAPRLAAFCGTVVAVAMVWGTAGWLAQRGAAGPRVRMIQRIASVWLAVVSVAMVAVVIRA